MAITHPWTTWLDRREDCAGTWASSAELLGHQTAWNAVLDGTLAIGHAHTARVAATLAPDVHEALCLFAWLGRVRTEDVPLLRPNGLAELVAAGTAVRALGDECLEVDPFAASWWREQGGQDAFIRAMEPLGQRLRTGFWRTMHLPLEPYGAAAERLLALSLQPVWVDIMDRGRVFELTSDPERARTHLLRLENWQAQLPQDLTLRRVLNRHRTRVGGHEDQVVQELQVLLAQVEGIAQVEARIDLVKCLGRIGCRAEALEVAAEAPVLSGDGAPLWVQLQAQAASEVAMAGDLDAADLRLQDASRLAEARGLHKLHRTVQGILAMVALIRGDLALARARLDLAQSTVSTMGRYNATVHTAFRAVLAFRQGDRNGAAQWLPQTDDVDARSIEPALLAALAAGMAGHATGFHRARELAAAHGSPDQQALVDHLQHGAPCPASWDVLPTLRLLGLEPDAPRLEVAPDGQWFDAGNGRVDLSRSERQARVLAGLAAAGRPLTTSELFELGWPGETILPESAANRLYVVLNSLRKAGLRDWLTRRDGGYELRRSLGEV